MVVELRPIESVKPYHRNPRKNEAAVEVVAKSLREFGFRQPLVIDADGVVIVGHTRLKAAQKLGLAQVPVHVAEGLTPAQAAAYRIADNQTASIAEWDLELLPLELTDLKEMNFDLGLLGWTPEELGEIMAPPGNPGLTDPDDVPEPPDAATTQPGDLWVLGNHRLLCGDSSLPADVDRLLDGKPIHLCNTDPPYNVRVEPRSNNAIVAGLSSFSLPDKADQHDQQSADLNRYPEKGRATHKKLRAKDRPLANDFVSDAEFDRLLSAWFGNISRVLVPGGCFYIWGGYANCGNYPPVLKANELYFAQAIIWDKQHPVLTRKDFMGAHEWCFYGWREGAGHHFYGPNNVPDLWHVKKVNPQSMVHLTEKPVELAARAMSYSSKAGEHVLDLFGGSGSTLMAAEQQGRRAFLMELDPLYCDVIVQRWEQFTGKKAERV
ncbi:MAG: ParB N-terminal domain-containing protein [Planctomycetes bacterium]|nr:ParB N-terminal domain-containing protein [Planctomycetota bacterium]